MLRGTAVDITEYVTLAGVDDPTGASLELPASTDEHALLQRCDRNRFIILIKHQPRLDIEANIRRRGGVICNSPVMSIAARSFRSACWCV